jgi:hypothetical protein
MICEFEHNLFVYLYFSLWLKLETDKPINKVNVETVVCLYVYMCMELTSLSVDNVNELHFFPDWGIRMLFNFERTLEGGGKLSIHEGR